MTDIPLPLAPGWLSALPDSLPTSYKHWLLRPGVLTEGLRELGTVRLRVLGEYTEDASDDEASGLGIAPATPVWVREIMMSVNGVDSVMGRSLTPLEASHGVWERIRQLSTRPLADMLFHDPSVTRSEFVCRRLVASVPFYESVQAVIDDSSAELWARRSAFWRDGQPLLVAECFLPAFWGGSTAIDPHFSGDII